MQVTEAMKSSWPAPEFKNGTWVELTENIEGPVSADGRCWMFPVGTRGRVTSAAAASIIARDCGTIWEYTIEFEEGVRCPEISGMYLKPLPWLVQLALAGE